MELDKGDLEQIDAFNDQYREAKTDLEALVKLVTDMRGAQKEYFADRKHSAMIKAMNLESQVDKTLKSIKTKYEI